MTIIVDGDERLIEAIENLAAYPENLQSIVFDVIEGFYWNFSYEKASLEDKFKFEDLQQQVLSQ